MKNLSFGSKSIVVGLSLATVVACSKSKDDASTSPTASATAAAILNVANKMAQADLAKYATTVSTTSLPADENAPAFSVQSTSMTSSDWTSDWTGATGISNLYCGGNSTCGGAGQPSQTSSPKKWLDNMLDRDFINSNTASVGLMGRFFAAVRFPCFVTQVLGSLPAAGTYTKTITSADVSAANAVCGSNMTISQSFDLTIDVTDVTGQFDKKLHFTATGFVDQYFLFKDDASYTRIMTTETNSNQGYPQLSRYYAEYNKSTKVGRFEGLERGFPSSDGQMAGFYFYRVHLDETTNEVRILGQNGGMSRASGTTSRGNSTMVGGHGAFGQNLATIEIMTKNATGGAGLDSLGCIDMNAGTVSSGGACSGRAVDLSAAADALVNTTIFGMSQASWKTDETVGALTFDDTTIFSASPAN